jgi:hypothetical protein
MAAGDLLKYPMKGPMEKKTPLHELYDAFRVRVK